MSSDSESNGKGGRPCLIDQHQEEFIELLLIGCTYQEACAELGITYRTFRNWMQRGEEGEEPFAGFYIAVDRAVHRGTVKWRRNLHNNKLDVKERRLALDYLRYKQRDKPRQVELVESKRRDNVPKVGIREFIVSPDYLGKKEFWPKSLDLLEEATAPGIQGFLLDWGLGGGKSYFASALQAYKLYETAYEEVILGSDPRIRFGLAAETKIAFVNAALNANNAKDIVFGVLKSFVEQSPWFIEYLPHNPNVKKALEFERDYVVFAGGGKISSVVGHPIKSAVADELNLFENSLDASGTKGEDYADTMYTELRNRTFSRFGEEGYLGGMSASRTVNDFTRRKRQELLTDPEIARRYFLPRESASWTNWPEHRCRNTPGGRNKRWRRFDTDTMQFIDSVEEAHLYDQIREQL